MELFQKNKVQTELFEAPAPPVMSDNVAANRAFEEQIVARDSGSFEPRYQQRKKEGIVMDAVVERLLDLNKESKINEIVLDQSLTLEQKEASIRAEMDRIAAKKLNPYDELLFQAMRLDGGSFIPLDQLEGIYQETSALQLSQLSKMNRDRQLARGRQHVDETAASHGWDSFGDMMVEVGIQDFVPVWNVVTRMGLADYLAKAAGVEMTWWQSVLPGEARQAIREHLVSLDPDEFNETVRAMSVAMEEIQADPLLGPLVTDYNAIEFWQNTFTEGVLTQEDASNLIDRIADNASTALEAVFSAAIVAKIGRTVKNSFSVSSAVRAKQAAGTVRNTQAANQLVEALQEDALAAKFQLEIDAVAPELLPKPGTLLDDIERAPEGVREVLGNARRLRDSIFDIPQSRGQGLLETSEKANVIRKELDKLNEYDGAVINTRMSTITVPEDDSGVVIHAIMGETPTRGWVSFEDAANAMLDLDPQMRTLELMRVGDDLKLHKIDLDPQEFELAIEAGLLSPTRTAEIIGSDEFFIRYRQERPWHPLDKVFFGPGTLKSSIARPLLTPNAKFSDQFYSTFARAGLDEQRVVGTLNEIASPWRNLSPSDKKFVASTYEWMEEFGREHGRNPTVSEWYSKYPEMTPAQMEGTVALRATLDTMYDLLNQRVYLEWKAAGFRTGKPKASSMPTFHGKVYDTSVDVKPGTFLNPVTQEAVRLSKADIQELYVRGGSVLETEIHLDTLTPKVKTKRVILDPDYYQVRDLTSTPLEYHPGYTMRFYDDPFYVVRSEEIIVDGTKTKVDRAIRTAASEDEALVWMNRAAQGGDKRSYRVARVRDLTQSESRVLQQDTLRMEGRLFYDKRNFDRLQDVYGNRARLDDPVLSMERGIHMVARQLTNEDPLRAAKKAWENQYGRKFLKDYELAGKDLHAVRKALRSERLNRASFREQKEISDAITYIDYFRVMEGVSDDFTPWLRNSLLNAGTAVARATGTVRTKAFRGYQKWAEALNPLQAARSVAFTAFMRLRPVRQYLMQSAQVLFLTGVDPRYVGTGRIFRDMGALRHGQLLERTGRMTTDVSVTKLAKLMGLSEKQYRKLVKEFDRSGLLDTVDVHAYTGTTSHESNMRLPSSAGGRVAFEGRRAWESVKNTAGRGFTGGESNNLAGTYMVALRRYLTNNKVDDLLQLNADDWNKIRVDASNMALAMIKPNNMKYQTGLFSLATQFLSFQHRAMLALLGQNPALKGADVYKLWVSGTMLYGAEFYGASEFVGAVLSASELEHTANMEVPGTGGTVHGILQYGLIDKIVNEMGSLAFDEEWADLDLSFLSPGLQPSRQYGEMLSAIWSDTVSAAFGPSANIFGRVGESLDFAYRTVFNSPSLSAEEKALRVGEHMLRILPQANDAVSSYMAHKYNQWYTAAGEPMPLEPQMNEIIARGLAGVRSREQMSYYQMQREFWENEQNYRDTISYWQDHFTYVISRYHNNELSYSALAEQASTFAHLYEDMPEGRRTEMYDAIFLKSYNEGPSIMEKMSQEMAKGNVNYYVLDAVNNMDLPEDQKLLLQEMMYEVLVQKPKQELELKEELE